MEFYEWLITIYINNLRLFAQLPDSVFDIIF